MLLDADADDARVIWYDYDQNGRLTGYRLDTRPDTIARAVAVRNLVVTHATALRAWTGHGGMSQE